MIPKIIHYCWFGEGKKSPLFKKCFDSWRKYNPDYDIIEWNETNIEINKLPNLIKQFYNLKKWAYVSDYVRLFVLKNHGGVYLDTDMLILKNIDSFTKYKFFIGAESDDLISCGIIGSMPNHIILQNSLKFYETYPFIFEEEVLKKIKNFEFIIPRLLTDIIVKDLNISKSFKDIINLNDCVIYPPEYFYPVHTSVSFDVKNYKKYITKNTFAVHFWDASWVEYDYKYYLMKGKYLIALYIMIKKSKFNFSSLKYYLIITKRILLNKFK
jgi:mannosyltransferase OCH1-like enzyme